MRDYKREGEDHESIHKTAQAEDAGVCSAGY